MPTLILYTYSHKYMLTCHTSPRARAKNSTNWNVFFFSTAVYYLVYLTLTSQVRWPVTHLWSGSKKDSCRKVKPFYFFYFIPLTLLTYILYIHNILYYILYTASEVLLSDNFITFLYDLAFFENPTLHNSPYNNLLSYIFL